VTLVASTAALALGAFLSAGAIGCGGTSKHADSDARPGSTPPDATTCPLDYTGGFPARPAARWVRAVVEQAGYEVVDHLHTGLVAAGRGREFFVWATEPSGPHAPRPEEHDVLAEISGVDVRGDPRSVRWWPTQGLLFWIHRGTRSSSTVPRSSELAALVNASLALPAAPLC
jgi:hypothetical protein